MKTSDKLKLENSERRQKLATLSEVAEPTEAQVTEIETLTAEYRACETRLRGAVIAEQQEQEQLKQAGTGDGEAAELRALRARVKVSSYAAAALEQRAVNGVEREFNQAIEIQENRFPLELLAPEQRADTDTDAGAMQRGWLDRLFSDTAAMRLGVTFESVGPGIAAYPATTAGASAKQLGRSETPTDAAWTVGVTELKPSRNSVRAVFNGTDADRLPMLEDALRRDLASALTEGIDRVIFTGDTGADENPAKIKGLTTISNVVEVTLKQADKVGPAKVAAAFAAFIDGKHAASASDLRVVTAVGMNTLLLSTVVGTGSQVSLAKFMMDNGINWTVRGDIETATASGDWGAFVGRGRRIAGAAVAPIWRSAQLVRDVYTGAAKDEIALTLITSWNFGVVRPTQFGRIKFVA